MPDFDGMPDSFLSITPAGGYGFLRSQERRKGSFHRGIPASEVGAVRLTL
jgi:hypothetical protein